VTRFRVVSIGGWTINQGAHGASGAKYPVEAWYVLDSACCYRVVREFRAVWRNKHGRATPERDARAFAAQLESDYP
jgi:hypothetical protein